MGGKSLSADASAVPSTITTPVRRSAGRIVLLGSCCMLLTNLRYRDRSHLPATAPGTTKFVGLESTSDGENKKSGKMQEPPK